MKRRDMFGLAAAGSMAAVASPAVAQSMPSVKWRCVSSFPKSIPLLWGISETIAKAVAETTDGKFQIQPFAAGEIVPALQVMDAVTNGTVEMGHSAAYYYTGKNAALAFATHVPFGLNTRQHNAWIRHGEGANLVEGLFKKYGIVAIPAGNTGAQMGGWFRKEVTSVEDLKGLKFRISGLGGLILSRLGVVPQQVAGGDIYPALERGTIDAAEFNGAYDDEKLGLYKVAPNYHFPGWWDGTSMEHTMIGQAAWDALPKHYQAALRSACAVADVDCLSNYDALNPPALKRLLGLGVKLRPFPNEVIEACYKAAMAYYDETSAANAEFKAFYDSMRRFQADSAPWYQVSEFSYDSATLRMLRR